MVELTKREYFAGLAMQGLWAKRVDDTDYYLTESDLNACVAVAEALIEELERTAMEKVKK